MQHKDHISDLFKEAFENYEEPVRPELWQQVAAKIQAPSPAPAPDGTSVAQVAGVASKASVSIGTWITGAVIVVSVATGYYFYDRSSLNTVGTTELPAESSLNNAQLNNSSSEQLQNPAVNETTLDNAVEMQSSVPHQKNSTAANDNSVAIQADQEPTGTEHTSPINSAGNQVLPDAPVAASDESQHQVSDPQPAGISLPENLKSDHDAVKPKISASTLSGNAPLSVIMTAVDGAENIEWNFGDGSGIYKGSRINHVFSSPGSYLVTMKSTDDQGRSYSDIVRVEVFSDLTILNVPNIFTPNGDGTNDIFQVTAGKDVDIEVTIFDQSGKFIHRFKGGENGWNGKINNQEDAAGGTYFYVIFATGVNGGQNIQKGTITLKR